MSNCDSSSITTSVDDAKYHCFSVQVRVRKHGDAKKYTAHLICIGHECDIAMVNTWRLTCRSCVLHSPSSIALKFHVVCLSLDSLLESLNVHCCLRSWV